MQERGKNPQDQTSEEEPVYQKNTMVLLSSMSEGRVRKYDKLSFHLRFMTLPQICTLCLYVPTLFWITCLYHSHNWTKYQYIQLP